MPPKKRPTKAPTLPSFDLASNICTEADKLLPPGYVPIPPKRMDEIRNYRWEKGLRAISRSMMARQSCRPISSQRKALKESKRLEALGIKKPGLTAEDLATLPTVDVYKSLSSLSLVSVESSITARSRVRSPPRSEQPGQTAASSASSKTTSQGQQGHYAKTEQPKSQPYEGQGVGRKETCKEDTDSDPPPWSSAKKPRPSTAYEGAGVGHKQTFARQPPPPPSPPSRKPTSANETKEDIVHLSPDLGLKVVNLTRAAPPPPEYVGYPVHQGVIVLPPECAQSRIASRKEQEKGKNVIHSFPFTYPTEFPLELDIHATIQKDEADPIEMTLKLNRTPAMKGVTRAVYNFKGGEFYSVFKLAVVAPPEEGTQDGLQAHESELDLARSFPEMVPKVTNVFAIQIRVASAVNPLDFPLAPRNFSSTSRRVASWSRRSSHLPTCRTTCALAPMNAISSYYWS